MYVSCLWYRLSFQNKQSYLIVGNCFVLFGSLIVSFKRHRRSVAHTQSVSQRRAVQNVDFNSFSPIFSNQSLC